VSAPGRVSAAGARSRAWIRAAPRSVREEVEAAAVERARTLLRSPRRTFTRAQIRGAVARTEAAMFPGRRRAAVWPAPGPGRRVPEHVRSLGSMRGVRPMADVAAFLAREGVPFDPEANPRRRRRREGRDLARRGEAYVFRVNGIRQEAADRILSSLHAEGLRAMRAETPSLVRRLRYWELIYPRVVNLSRGSTRSGPLSASVPDIGAVLEHARRFGAAIVLLYLRTRSGGVHAVALSVVPTPRGPSATAFRAAAYDPLGEVSYRSDGLERWLAGGAAASSLGRSPKSPAIRLELCRKLRAVAVQYGKEGSCVPGALALVLRLAALRGNRRGGCARPYQELRREDAVVAAQLVTWYGVFLSDRQG
jgi:hypothetical protein